MTGIIQGKRWDDPGRKDPNIEATEPVRQLKLTWSYQEVAETQRIPCKHLEGALPCEHLGLTAGLRCGRDL